MRNPILERWAGVLSGRFADPAVLDSEGEILRTFSGIERESEIWGEKLSSLASGCVIGLQIGNSPEWPAILLGAWRVGLIVVPFDFDLAGERRTRIEKLCGVSARIELVGSGSVLVPQANPPVEWASPALQLLKLTSGTTGDARAIRFTAAQLLADCDTVCDTMDLRESDRNYGAIAFSHSYGLSNLITPLLCRGVPLVVAGDLMPRALLDGMAKSSATVLPAVPAIYRSLSEFHPGVSSLRRCISAGAPLSPEIAGKFFTVWGRKVHSFYGASECGGICYDAEEDPDVPRGYVGPAMKNVTIRLSEETEASRIEVRSGAVGSGYFPAGTDEAMGEGTFQPADLLERSGDGYVITGRLSELINVAGRKVSPGEIEQVLRMSPRVRDAVVLGLPAHARGEEVAACVSGEATEDELRTLCARNLPAWQVPRHWFLWDEIPLTARGKINRTEIRARLQGGRAQSGL